MFNPLDLLQGPGATGMQAMGRQFGLDPEQTRRAMEALMPAFALGMQRASADPTGLGQMFGSPVLTQAVLQQASAASGVGSQVLRQMLPAMAGAVVASVVHMVLNQPAAAPAPAPAPPSHPFPAAAAWTEMMQAFLPAAAPPPAPNPAAARSPAARSPESSPAAGGEAADIGRDMLQHLLRTGAEVQAQNVRAMQGLFEAFWSDPRGAGGPVASEAGPGTGAGGRPGAGTRPGTPEAKGRRGRGSTADG